jgi:glycosyltransferase involved in cell wall biosynthesis
MSQGIPVVISNRSALPEINGNAALYFDPDDVDEIKNSLNKVMLDKNLRAELIQNGKEQLNKFNSEKNIKKTIDIIQDLKL